ncbi:MAG: hypothetical protein DSZ28_03110 [Thiothrix sp.]|nr:MAG: hypothetical protein DSZ28_03110 [Thiothrix sp.]
MKMTLIKYLVTFLLLIASSNALAAPPTFSLPYNQWRMISLPATPSVLANTVEAILGDNMAAGGVYQQNWIVYVYDTSSNSYRSLLSLADTMEKDKGYWIIQNFNKGTVRLDMPVNSTETPSSESIPLAASINGSNQWTLAGNPFATPLALGDLRLSTTAPSCNDGRCNLDKAKQNKLINDQVWTYNGSRYEKKGTNNQLDAWSGFWTVSLSNSQNHTLSLQRSNTEIKAIPVYNQAYQENFSADTIAEILNSARNAYVLVDALEDDIGKFVNQIKSKQNQVAGYISAGTGENYRSDFEDLKPYLSPTAWPQWPDEFFVSETTTGILPLMKKRIDKIAAWGADWIEFDNMDWLDEKTRQQYNLSATVPEANAYINALCDHTHAKGMNCMAKNTVDNFTQFDGVLYESYQDQKNWWDTQGTREFLTAGKRVIINHYNEANCDAVYAEYIDFYDDKNISFICEDTATKKYKHYNQE